MLLLVYIADKTLQTAQAIASSHAIASWYYCLEDEALLASFGSLPLSNFPPKSKFDTQT
jgi:hypothetical protein